MTANATVVDANEFFCVPVGKSRQAAIFLGSLVKNAIEEGKSWVRAQNGSRTSASPSSMHTQRITLQNAAE